MFTPCRSSVRPLIRKGFAAVLTDDVASKVLEQVDLISVGRPVVSPMLNFVLSHRERQTCMHRVTLSLADVLRQNLFASHASCQLAMR